MLKSNPVLVAEILQLLKEFLAEGPYNSLPINEDYLSQVIDSFLTEEGKYVGWTRTADGKMVGLLGAALFRNPITFQVQGSEMVLYVRPEYRKSRVAQNLITGFEDWARERGAKFTGLTLHNNKYHDTLTRFYQSLGYKKVEETFVKELN